MTSERVLSALRWFLKTRGYSPTLRELMAATGASSTSVIAYHLYRLESDGLIEREPGKARTIRPVEAA